MYLPSRNQTWLENHPAIVRSFPHCNKTSRAPRGFPSPRPAPNLHLPWPRLQPFCSSAKMTKLVGKPFKKSGGRLSSMGGVLCRYRGKSLSVSISLSLSLSLSLALSLDMIVYFHSLHTCIYSVYTSPLFLSLYRYDYSHSLHTCIKYIYIYMYIHNYIIYISYMIYVYQPSLSLSLPHQQSLDLQFTVRGNLQRFSTLPNSWGFPADVDVCLNSFWDGKPKCLVTFPSKMMMNPRSRVTKWSKMAGWEGPALERNI